MPLRPAPAERRASWLVRGLVLPATAALCVVPVVLTGAVGSAGASSTKSSTSATGTKFVQEGASAILSAATEASKEAGAAKIVGTTKEGGVTDQTYGSLSSRDAGQSLRSNGRLVLQVLKNGLTVYIRESSASVLEHTLGLSSSAATGMAGKWISVNPGEQGYDDLVDALSLSAEVHQYTPEGRLRLERVRRLDGDSVVPVTGLPDTPVQGKASGSATLYVRTASPHVPLAGSLFVQDGKVKVTEQGTFTEWGVPVKLSPPKGAIPLGSLQKS